MSVKGSWWRPHSKKSWDESPLWDNIEKKKAEAEEAEKKVENKSESNEKDV